MNTVLLILMSPLLQGDGTVLDKAADKLARYKSYSFRIVQRKKKEVSTSTGMYIKEKETIYLKGAKGEILVRDGKTWVRKIDEDWKELPAPRVKKKAVSPPHELAAKLARMVEKPKKETSGKVGTTTVDVYPYNLYKEAARKAAEASGEGLRGLWSDITPTKTGLFFHVGRGNGLLYRVEQIHAVGTSSRPDDDIKVTIDFSDFGRAKLPRDVKKLVE